MSRYRDDNIQENINDRTPPQNVDLEMCVLGGIMLEPVEAMPLVSSILRPDDFYLDGHGVIYELALELHSRGIPPDSVALLDELRGRGQMERVGGSAVVMGMLNAVPTAANVEYHARKVSEKAKLRRMIRSCTELVDECYRQELPADQIAHRMYAAAVVHEVEGPEEELFSIRHACQEFYEAQSQPLPAIPTGYRQLDNMTRGGFAKGQLHTVLAQTSHGKTAFMLNIAVQQAVGMGIPCLIFSIEMDRKQLFERLVTSMTTQVYQPDYQLITVYDGVNNYLMQGNRMQAQDERYQSMLAWAQSYLNKAPIHIIDAGYMTPAKIRKAVMRYARGKESFSVFVDYYQILESDERGVSKLEKLQAASGALRQLARDINNPIVVAAQIRREFQGSRPRHSDVEACNQITQDSYTCMVIDQPELRSDKNVERRIIDLPADVQTIPEARLYLDKNRNGQAGLMLRYHYVGPMTRFMEVTNNGGANMPDVRWDWTRGPEQ